MRGVPAGRCFLLLLVKLVLTEEPAPQESQLKYELIHRHVYRSDLVPYTDIINFTPVKGLGLFEGKGEFKILANPNRYVY